MKSKLSLIVLFVSLFGLMGLADPISRPRSYVVTCSTTPQKMLPASGQKDFSAFKFEVEGAETVYIGGADLTFADRLTKGFTYATTTKDAFDGPPGAFYCVTGASTSDVQILAGAK